MNDNQSQGHQNVSQIPREYRPKSPDLSGIVAPPPAQLSRLPSLPLQDLTFPQGYSLSSRGSYDASPYFSPQAAQAASYFGNQDSQLPPAVEHSHQSFFAEPQSFAQPQSQDEMARLRNRPQVNYNDDAYNVDEFDQRAMLNTQQRIPPQPQPVMTATHPFQQTHQPYPQAQQIAPQSVPTQPQQSLPSIHQPSLPQVEIRTKFPVARIKRIMQADEEIGKVAQATPTAVAKALECFMIALVSKGSLAAKEQNSKRVTATHLKNALLADPQFDFLKEICENVAEEAAKRPKVKGDKGGSEESDVEEETGGPAKKARKGGGKKRKTGDDSD